MISRLLGATGICLVGIGNLTQSPDTAARGALLAGLWLFAAVGVLSAPVQSAFADYVPEYDDSEIVLHLMGTADIETINARWGTYTLDAFADADLYLVAPQVPGQIPEISEQMESDPDIRSAHPNFVQDTPEGIRQLLIIAVGGDYVDFEDQSVTYRIGLDEAHSVTRGAGITVAVLDTGVDPSHEALAGRLATTGYDFVSDDTEPWEEANGLDDDGDLIVDEGYGHGTMVAGIIALVAPEATILPIRVLDDDARADAFRICEAIRYAAMNGADVINMSLGIPVEIEAIEAQIEFIEQNDILLVAGAGNEARGDAPFFPAADERVLMVSAVDSLDVKATFADWGPEVDIVAPGTGIRSAYPGDEWALGAGCSFATPFVSGAAALVRAVEPDLEVGYWRDRVLEGVQTVDNLIGNAPYAGLLGAGRIYLPAAVSDPADAGESIAAGAPWTAFPNPATTEVHFRSHHPAGALGRLRVIDARGRHVAWITPSRDGWFWDTADDRGRPVGSGVYFARPEAAGAAAIPIRILR